MQEHIFLRPHIAILCRCVLLNVCMWKKCTEKFLIGSMKEYAFFNEQNSRFYPLNDFLFWDSIVRDPNSHRYHGHLAHTKPYHLHRFHNYFF